MSYVERDGIWHIVARTDNAEAFTVCNLRTVQQTYLLEREPSPVCGRCEYEAGRAVRGAHDPPVRPFGVTRPTVAGPLQGFASRGRWW
jgi:hypothetical protein